MKDVLFSQSPEKTGKLSIFNKMIKLIMIIFLSVITFSISFTISYYLYNWSISVGKIQIKQMIINSDNQYDPRINKIRGSYPPHSREYFSTYDEDLKSYKTYFKKNYAEQLENYYGFEEYHWNIKEVNESQQIVTFSATYTPEIYYGKTYISRSQISNVEYESLKRIVSEDNLRSIRGEIQTFERVYNRIEEPELIQNIYRNGLEYDMDNFLILINDYYRLFMHDPNYYITNNKYLVIEELYNNAKESNSDLLYLFETLYEKNTEEFKYLFTELLYESFYIPDYKQSKAFIDIEFEYNNKNDFNIKNIVISEKNIFRLKPEDAIYIEILLPFENKTPQTDFAGFYLWDLNFKGL